MAVRPDMVVFGVNSEHAGEEGNFIWRQGRNVGHDYLTMVPERVRILVMQWHLEVGEVPYLEILDILDGDSVQPLKLLE